MQHLAFPAGRDRCCHAGDLTSDGLADLSKLLTCRRHRALLGVSPGRRQGSPGDQASRHRDVDQPAKDRLATLLSA